MSTPTTNSLQIKRLIKASPDCLFKMWTTPAHIKKWFGPATCRVLDAKVDLRVGGEYRFQVTSTEMGDMSVRGVYREIKSPSKLVYTWQWENDEDWTNMESVVTVEFVKKDGGTEVQVTHEGLPTEESAGHHEHGWTGCMDKLSTRMAVASEMCGPGHVSWNELLTTDVKGATKFYSQLFGWTMVPFGEGMDYTLLHKGDEGVGGMMKVPKPGMPAQWVAYVTVEDVDASAAKVAKLGGQIMMPPFDVPTVGRIAILLDPQGAALGLFTPKM